jgi:hypothetical protein
MDAAKGRDAAAFTEAAREKAAAEAELRKAGGGNMTAEQRAQARFGMAATTFQQGQQDRVAKAADKAAKEEKNNAMQEIQLAVESNPKAFPLAQSYLPPERAEEDDEMKRKRAEAKATDANRISVEIRAAVTSATPEDYFAKAFDAERVTNNRWKSLTPAEKRAVAVQQLGEAEVAERERVFNLAKKTGLGGSSVAADEINRLNVVKDGAAKLTTQ